MRESLRKLKGIDLSQL